MNHPNDEDLSLGTPIAAAQVSTHFYFWVDLFGVFCLAILG